MGGGGVSREWELLAKTPNPLSVFYKVFQMSARMSNSDHLILLYKVTVIKDINVVRMKKVGGHENS